MGARKFQLFTNMDLTRATSFAWAKLYVSVCRFQLFTNMDLTRATSFAWAKLYVSARKFQLFTNMDLTRMELKFDDWNETP